MKKLLDNKFFKAGGIVAIVTALCLTNLSALAQPIPPTETDKKSSIQHENIAAPSSLETWEEILTETFDNGVWPPLNLTNISYSNNETWYLDSSDPYSDDYCGTVHRGSYLGIQDEWLITPSLDFSDYEEIKLSFYWYTSQLTAQHNDVIDLNVSVTTDNGGNWTVLWNEDALPDIISWEWYQSEIDLKDYTGETNVKIGFQYYSNNISDAYAQEFSIDDIVILGNTTSPFWCTAGGDLWVAWSWNNMYGVQFHGDAGDGTPPYLNWTWDFGDDEKSILPFSPIHKYDQPGVYDVHLEVRDSARPRHVAEDDITVTIVETPPPELRINVNAPSVGIVAEVSNTGTLNVSYIDWKMTVEWGPMKVKQKEVKNDTIPYIEAGSLENIRSPYYFFGFGFIKITIDLIPSNTNRQQVVINALKLGPFILWVEQ